MRLPLKAEWDRLRREVQRVDAEMQSGVKPTPTTLMCELLIAGEDRRFRFHPGVDPVGLVRAIWKTIVFHERQGGSTIAMQLVRTVSGRYEKTLKRKCSEIVLSLLLTHHFGRERLPMFYLYVAYYGWRMNNFRQACARLGIKLDAIDDMEAARLVARLKYPQPCRYGAERIRRIERRARHLIALKDHRHMTGDSYGTVQSCRATPRYH